MNYIKNEQRLVEEQLKLATQLKYLEMLSSLATISNDLQSKIPERISVTIKSEENLGVGDFVLPLKVVGRMLGIGRHKHKYYSEEELKKSVVTHGKKKLSFKLDHKKDETSSTVGAVDRIYWDDDEKAIMYEGHINSEIQARNIIDGVVKEISAGILSMTRLDTSYGVIGTNLEYTELSLVEAGSYKENTIGVK